MCIIRRTRTSNEDMPEIQVRTCDRLRDNRLVTLPVLELALPRVRAVLPYPVGTVYTPQHPRKTPLLVDGHLFLDGFWRPNSKENILILGYEPLTEGVRRLPSHVLLNTRVFVNGVKGNPVREDP